MTAHELLEARPDAVLMAQRKLLLGDQLMVEQIGFEQHTRVRNRWLLLDHALLEARLRGALAPAHLGAAGLEWRQQAAGAEHDHVRNAIWILERDTHGGAARGGMCGQWWARGGQPRHEARDGGNGR